MHTFFGEGILKKIAYIMVRMPLYLLTL